MAPRTLVELLDWMAANLSADEVVDALDMSSEDLLYDVRGRVEEKFDELIDLFFPDDDEALEDE